MTALCMAHHLTPSLLPVTTYREDSEEEKALKAEIEALQLKLEALREVEGEGEETEDQKELQADIDSKEDELLKLAAELNDKVRFAKEKPAKQVGDVGGGSGCWCAWCEGRWQAASMAAMAGWLCGERPVVQGMLWVRTWLRRWVLVARLRAASVVVCGWCQHCARCAAWA